MAAQSREMVLPPWGEAVAGATGAVLANAMVYPLDLIKTKLQVQTKNGHNGALDREHYKSTWDALAKITGQEGVSGLYAGMTGCLLGVTSTNFAYFYWYTLIRRLYLAHNSGHPGTTAELSLGAVAGALAQLFTIPVAVVTTRQQTVPKHDRLGLLATANQIIDGEDGWTGLWRGLKASLVLVANPSITHAAYQHLRLAIVPGKASLSATEAFCLGAMSKALATIMTQPLIVAKVGLQSDPPPQRNGMPFKSFNQVMAHIVEHEGATRLFKGLGPQLLKGLLVQGFLMMTKEKIQLIFILLLRKIKLFYAQILHKSTASMQTHQSLVLLSTLGKTLQRAKLRL